MADAFGDVSRPSRRQRRLINFLAPQLQPNEQIEKILTLAYQRKPFWLSSPTPTSAIVLTNQRVFEIRLQMLTARPKKTIGAHARESTTAEWTRHAYLRSWPPGVSEEWVSELTISSPVGTQTFWVRGRAVDRAQAIAARLNTGRF